MDYREIFQKYRNMRLQCVEYKNVYTTLYLVFSEEECRLNSYKQNPRSFKKINEINIDELPEEVRNGIDFSKESEHIIAKNYDDAAGIFEWYALKNIEDEIMVAYSAFVMQVRANHFFEKHYIDSDEHITITYTQEDGSIITLYEGYWFDL